MDVEEYSTAVDWNNSSEMTDCSVRNESFFMDVSNLNKTKNIYRMFTFEIKDLKNAIGVMQENYQ